MLDLFLRHFEVRTYRSSILFENRLKAQNLKRLLQNSWSTMAWSQPPGCEIFDTGAAWRRSNSKLHWLLEVYLLDRLFLFSTVCIHLRNFRVAWGSYRARRIFHTAISKLRGYFPTVQTAIGHGMWDFGTPSSSSHFCFAMFVVLTNLPISGTQFHFWTEGFATLEGNWIPGLETLTLTVFCATTFAKDRKKLFPSKKNTVQL